MKLYIYHGFEEELSPYELSSLGDAFLTFSELVETIKKYYDEAKENCVKENMDMTEDEFHVDEEQEIVYVSIYCEGDYRFEINSYVKVI